MKQNKNLAKEVENLKKLDPILAKIILTDLNLFNNNENLNAQENNVYEALISSIISQQISTGAARSIKAKFLKLFNNKFPNQKKLLETSDEVLRNVGLSKQKISYLKNVAEHFLKEILDEQKFLKMSDEEIINDLIKIKGVGQWTVEMILMSTLKRPNVFSFGDLALRNVIYKLYKINPNKYKAKNLKKKVLQISENWAPYKSLACMYLWNAKDDGKF